MPLLEFLLICDIKRVLMTHMGLVTIVEEAPATIEEQKLTIFGLSDGNISHDDSQGVESTYRYA
jgi:hypothetical protein